MSNPSEDEQHGAAFRAPAPRPSASATQVFAPGWSPSAARSAAAAVGALAVVLFLSALLTFLGTISYVRAMAGASDGFGLSPVGVFVDDWLFTPFMFYLGACAALTFVVPIVRESPLPTILLRTLLAGATGTVVLVIVGVFTGLTNAIRQNEWSYLLTDIVTDPLAEGIRCTAVLVATATGTWLWIGRASIAVPPSPPDAGAGWGQPRSAFTASPPPSADGAGDPHEQR